MHCNTLEHTATHCNHCNTLQHAHSCALQHTATHLFMCTLNSLCQTRHCNTLQHAATHCNTLIHMHSLCHWHYNKSLCVTIAFLFFFFPALSLFESLALSSCFPLPLFLSLSLSHSLSPSLSSSFSHDFSLSKPPSPALSLFLLRDKHPPHPVHRSHIRDVHLHIQ